MQWIAVAFGGALGAMARFALATLVLPPHPHRFPLATFTANLLGCFIIAVAYVLIVEKGMIDPLWRHVLMVGFLGAFTTFSTFSLEVIQLWDNGLHTMAVSYAVLSLVGSLMTAAIGLYITPRLF